MCVTLFLSSQALAIKRAGQIFVRDTEIRGEAGYTTVASSCFARSVHLRLNRPDSLPAKHFSFRFILLFSEVCTLSKEPKTHVNLLSITLVRRTRKGLLAKMAKKVIVVTGATGTQGSSVVHVLLQTGEWHVRAVTRNPDGEKAKALAAKGAEVVAADYDDEESVRKAFTVSYFVCCALSGGLNT